VGANCDGAWCTPPAPSGYPSLVASYGALCPQFLARSRSKTGRSRRCPTEHPSSSPSTRCQQGNGRASERHRQRQRQPRCRSQARRRGTMSSPWPSSAAAYPGRSAAGCVGVGAHRQPAVAGDLGDEPRVIAKTTNGAITPMLRSRSTGHLATACFACRAWRSSRGHLAIWQSARVADADRAAPPRAESLAGSRPAKGGDGRIPLELPDAREQDVGEGAQGLLFAGRLGVEHRHLSPRSAR
jgi:hypothetical protein